MRFEIVDVALVENSRDFNGLVGCGDVASGIHERDLPN